MPSVVEIGLLVLEKKFFFNCYFLIINCHIIYLSPYYLSWERRRFSILNKLESTSPTDRLCLVWLKMAHWFSRGYFQIRRLMYFRNFIVIFLWKRKWPYIWTNCDPLHPWMFCAKFGWNWPDASGEEGKNVKSLQTDRYNVDGRTDDGRQIGDEKGSHELVSHVNEHKFFHAASIPI